MINKLCKWWLSVRVYLSNLLYKKELEDTFILERYTTVAKIKTFAVDLYKNFTYEYDDITEFFDSMHKPAYCYEQYKSGLLKDDCDGFHAAVLHGLLKSGVDSYLFTYVPQNILNGHTTVVFKLDDKYYHLDYTTLKVYDHVDDIIDYVISKNGLLRAYDFVTYNYSKHKYECRLKSE